MNILLTGASGFLGSSLLKKFVSENYKIKILLRETSDLSRLPDEGNYEKILVKSFTDLKNKLDFSEFKNYSLVNCAWQGVQGSTRNELWQFKDNFNLMHELLDLATGTGCDHFINFGSHAEYGPLNKKITEKDIKTPTTAYGCAKKIINTFANYYLGQTSIKYTHLRVFNIYGPHDNESWFIPYVIKSVLVNEAPKLTKCEQIWDYLFIDDFTDIVTKILKSNQEGVFNLGSGNGLPLEYIVTSICQQMDSEIKPLFGAVPYRDDQVMYLEADIDCISKKMGWKPTVTIEKGLKKTIDFFVRKYS